MINFLCVDGPNKGKILKNQDFKPHQFIDLQVAQEWRQNSTPTKPLYETEVIVTYQKTTFATMISQGEVHIRVWFDVAYSEEKPKCLPHELPEEVLKQCLTWEVIYPSMFEDFEQWFLGVCLKHSIQREELKVIQAALAETIEYPQYMGEISAGGLITPRFLIRELDCIRIDGVEISG